MGTSPIISEKPAMNELRFLIINALFSLYLITLGINAIT